MIRVALMLALGGSLLAVVRVVGEPRPQHPEAAAALLGHMDADGDGRVSQNEYEAVGDGLLDFGLLDLDRDGGLALWEVDVLVRRVNPTILRPVHGGEGS